METIVKLIKALFFNADGEVEKTAVQKFKDGLLWMLLGIACAVGGLLYIADEDEDSEEQAVEAAYEAEPDEDIAL